MKENSSNEPSNNEDKDKKWVSISGLKYRGWTEGNIKNFLGEPDLLVKNPHYRSAAEMKLYSIDRVVSIESTDEFQNWQKSNEARRQKLKSSALKTMEKRRQELFRFVDTLEVVLPKFEKNKLRKQAVASYNALWASRGKCEKSATLSASDEFLDRISVNFLRHECSEYEHQIDMMFGKVGNDAAYHHLKFRILEKIGEQYSFLKEECSSQMV